MAIFCIIVFLMVMKIDTTLGDYCTHVYTTSRQIHWHCGTWGWSRCSGLQYSRQYYQKCCSGWTGNRCSTPICSNPCEHGGICISPEVCKCPVSFTGQQCTTNIPIQTTHNVITSTTTTSMSLSSSSRSPWVLRGNDTSDCVPEDKDVVFLVDSSSRDGEHNFQKVKEFIKQAVGTFDVGLNRTRVGLILFNTNATIVFPLDKFYASQDILNAVENIVYKPTNETNTGDALELVRKQGFTYDRPDVPNIVFLITDGYSSDKISTKVQACLAKQNSTIQIIATAVGQFVDFNELVDMASSNPYTNQSLIYHVDDFDDLHIGSLENVFTTVICGFELTTLPQNVSMSTMYATSPCYDLVKNCAEYRQDMCTNYHQWAVEHCKNYCGFCHGTTLVTNACEDQIGNCREYGPDICIATAFKKWTKEHCSSFCGLCGTYTTTRTQATKATIKAATTPAASTSDIGLLAKTSLFASTNTCSNNITNCEDFGQDTCTDYETWAREHCQQYCGFCQGSITTPKPCTDTVSNCNEYGPDICTSASFGKWTKDHCARFCKLCDVVNDATTTTISSSTP